MDDGKSASEREEERLKRARLVLIGKGLQFAGTVLGSFLIFLGGGIWLDRRLETSPLLLLIGLLLAFVAIGYSLYDLARTTTPKATLRPTTRPKKDWDDWDREERESDETERDDLGPRRKR